MSAKDVLRELSQRGVRVLVRGDRLTLRGPDEVLTAEFTERLRQIKQQILETVRGCSTCVECGAAIGPDERECWWGLGRVPHACGLATRMASGSASRRRRCWRYSLMDVTALFPDHGPVTLAGHLCIRVLFGDRIGFSGFVPAADVPALLRAADDGLGGRKPKLQRWLQVRRAVFSAAAAGTAEDVALLAALWTACRMPGSGRRVEKQLRQVLASEGQASLTIVFDPDTGDAATDAATVVGSPHLAGAAVAPVN